MNQEDYGNTRFDVSVDGVIVGSIDAVGDRKTIDERVRSFTAGLGLLADLSEPEQIFEQAFAFAKNARKVYETSLRASQEASDLPVFLVNAAFAIELFLKAMLAKIDGGFNKSHHLGKLYEQLPAADREAVANGLPFSPGEALHRMGNTFIEWRYIFESKLSELITAAELLHLCDSFSTLCREKIPVRQFKLPIAVPPHPAALGATLRLQRPQSYNVAK